MFGLLGLVLHAASAIAQFDKPGGTFEVPGMTPSAPHSDPADRAVNVSVLTSPRSVTAGGELVIAVVLDHAEGWHTWPAEAQKALPPEVSGFAIHTEVALESRPSWIARVGPIQWPTPSNSAVADPSGQSPTVNLPTYSHRAVVFIPVIVAPNVAPGPQVARVAVSFQACNDQMCQMPEDFALDVEVEVVQPGAGSDSGEQDKSIFEAFDQTVFAELRAGKEAVEHIEFDVFGLSFSIDPTGFSGKMLLFLVAALGGALLNLTPCVLPVIPLKIMGLSAAAGHPSRCFMLGLIMSLGVVAFWLGLAAAIVSITGFTAISSLFETPWFSIAVGVFIAVMGVGMIGVFTVQLPKFVYMFNPNHETVHGSFLFGVMTAVLSTPCTAPFMGAAAAWATRQPAAITFATFAAIGAGMALPYLILSANPKWVSRMPRSGAAGELVKQVMGILMLAVAAFFLGLGLVAVTNRPPDPPSRFYWWIVAVLAATAGGWLIWRTFKITKSSRKRALFAIVGLVIGGGGIAAAAVVTDDGPVNWTYYTHERFRQSLADGNVVVIDFTAEWCLNCKAIEKAVLYRRAVAETLNGKTDPPAGPRTIALKADLTVKAAEGWEKLREIGEVGIPLIAVFKPGDERPIFKSNAYTAQQVLDAIQAARTAAIADP